MSESEGSCGSEARLLTPGPIGDQWMLNAFDLGRCSEVVSWVDSEETKFHWAGSLFGYPVLPASLASHARTGSDVAQGFQCFQVEERASGSLASYFELSDIDQANRSVRLSRFLVGPPANRGRGLGNMFLQFIVMQVFALSWVHRFDLLVATDNTPAISCYKRAGFSIDGTLRECRTRRNSMGSIHVMSLLRSEWELDQAKTNTATVTYL